MFVDSTSILPIDLGVSTYGSRCFAGQDLFYSLDGQHFRQIKHVIAIDLAVSSDIPDGTYTVASVPNADSFTVDRSENTSTGYTSGFSTNGTFSYPDPNNYTLPKWGERTVGDEDTAPNPTLVGTKINNVFFFRNRLGFLADDNV